uniref:Lactoylglutathione lyase family protein n=1 Tax=uncultured marine thaumarchaeote KM3_73_F02 TaxID=1456268 RepID=A0A075HKB3_9ARCH|nr:Lactoylglutathione lyase family protein [uncultured marine thaumarchaeote KM3_73_F02]
MHLHHHCLVVKDMDEALKIFCDRMGMKLISRKSGFAENNEVAFVEESKTGHRMELFSRDNGSGKLDHIAYIVDDVDKTFNELRKKDGLEVDTEPFTLDQYNVRIAFLKDSNGFRIQLVKYL